MDRDTILSHSRVPDSPDWYRDAVIYQLHVRAFADSNGDGIGDFPGLTQKLDYLQDLGVTAIWLLPFYPSPLRDDGYDIADYTNVNPVYGSLDDFESFLTEAHRRGLRVITELVLNHTSDQHPWFQRARRAKPGSTWRDYYVWSADPKKYPEVRVIFQDFEPSNWTWDPVAEAYYWHRFYAHQPDLNFDNEEVQRATFEALDFWFSRGVDGLRLDAVPYLYEREGTNGENLPETHSYLKKLRRHVDERFPNRMLLAEANQWPEDAAAYFGEGDECHMAFHFPLMPRLFMALRMEERFPILDILQQTPVIPEPCQWALFLRNHDELTLEMVTDEERDYMYRLYAQDPQMRINLGIRRRLAPLLENHRAKIELMNGLMCSLPGTPVIYYGDEIGMGDNIYLGDRNGVRTPMQWNAERNAGFSHANPQRLFLPVIIDPECHFQAINVEAQQSNPHSLWWWMKRLIALRNRHQAFGRGTLEFVASDNPKVLAFLRQHDDERILVVANLSRLPQYVELDLNSQQGQAPVEMLGRTYFPPIANRPYPLSLAAYGIFWFRLEAPQAGDAITAETVFPTISVVNDWQEVFHGLPRRMMQDALPAYLERQAWFLSGPRALDAVVIDEVIPIPGETASIQLIILRCHYSDGDQDYYLVPVNFAVGARASEIRERLSRRIIANLTLTSEATHKPVVDSAGLLYDCCGDKALAWAFVKAVATQQRMRGKYGELVGFALPALKPLFDSQLASDESNPFGIGEGSTSVIYGDRLFLKIFRRLEAGLNPECELGRFLDERTDFHHTPPIAGSLEYRRSRLEPVDLAVIEELIPNQGDAWEHALDVVRRFLDQVQAQAQPDCEGILKDHSLRNLIEMSVPAIGQECLGTYLETIRLLGQRTAEFHAALASRPDNPNFSPEPFTSLYQRSLYQSLRGITRRTFRLLERKRSEFPKELRLQAETLLAAEEQILRRESSIYQDRIVAARIRSHGDYDLKNVLHIGNDFVIIGLEGDIRRPLSDRRRKRTPLCDVASMVFSLRAAADAALERSELAREATIAIDPWLRLWRDSVVATFLQSYLGTTTITNVLPVDRDQLVTLLDFYLTKTAISKLYGDLLHHQDRIAAALQTVVTTLLP